MRTLAACLLAPCLASFAAELPSSFRQALRRHAGPSCLVLEGKGTALAARFPALAAHEVLTDHDLNLLDSDWLKRDSDIARWALQQVGPTGWLLLNREGHILAQGKDWPQPEALAAQLQRAGFRSPIQVLREFLQAHPDHAEARVERIQLLYRRAQRRTRNLLAIPPHPKDPKAPDSTGTAWTYTLIPVPEVPAPLDAAQDERIWGELSRELVRHIESPHWGEAIPTVRLGEGYPSAVHSPLMRAVARRLLPRVQALIQDEPMALAAWWLWVELKRIGGLRADSAFLTSILPDAVTVEGDPVLPWPNEQAIMAVVEDARKHCDWADAKALLWGYWQVRILPMGRPRKARTSDPEYIKGYRWDTEADWRGCYAPMLEALVRTGEEGKTLEVARYVRELPYLAEPATRLRKLALELGRPDLAASWSR